MKPLELKYNNKEHLGFFIYIGNTNKDLTETIDECYMEAVYQVNKFIEENSGNENMEEDSTLEDDVNQAVISEYIDTPDIIDLFIKELNKENIVKLEVEEYTTKL